MEVRHWLVLLVLAQPMRISICFKRWWERRFIAIT